MFSVRAPSFALGALFLLWAVPLAAQTVRPVVVEYTGAARGKFEIVNDTLFPLNAIVEARSFSVSETGEPAFRPLDRGLQVRLSATSFRVPPQQTYTVYYEARAEQLPAWFVLYSTLAGFPRQQGLNVEVELPHTVYLLQKQKLQQADVRVSRAELAPEKNVLRVTLENPSLRLGRVLAVEAYGRDSKTKKTLAGFPLLPESRRELEIPWDAPAPPTRLLLRFRGFVLEQPVAAGAS
jgi:hypothetical protein